MHLYFNLSGSQETEDVTETSRVVMVMRNVAMVANLDKVDVAIANTGDLWRASSSKM